MIQHILYVVLPHNNLKIKTNNMKTVYLLLLLSLSAFANTTVKNTNASLCSNEITKENGQPSEAAISGLKIVNCTSKKLGKHVYVVSDLYTQKNVSFYNQKGDLVYTVDTVGSPILMSNFDKGTYTVKVVEGEKSEIRVFVVE